MLHCILPTLLAVLGGLGGFFLRRRELSTAFEPGTGLAVLWMPATVALIVLSVVLALVFALLCRGSKRPLDGYTAAFSAPGNWAFLVLTAIADALLLAGGLAGIGEEMTGGAFNPLRLALYILWLVSLAFLLTVAPDSFRGRERQYRGALLLPAYACCLWLVAAYQRHSADPVVLDYVYEMFAIVCTLLAFYFTAAFSFGRAKVWPCAFFCLLSVYFDLVTLADSHSPSARLLFLFSALYLLLHVTALLYHAFVKAPVLSAQPALSPDESDPTQEVPPNE